VPVIVLGTCPSLDEQAQTRGNVYTVLPMPFDLDELLEVVTRALARAPFEVQVQELRGSSEPALWRAGGSLVRSERELMVEWLQRIRAVPPFSDRSEISVREFLDNLPHLVNALALALPSESGAGLLTRDDAIRERMVDHVRMRVQQGLPVDALLREYQVFRDAIHKHLGRHLPVAEALKALERVNALLDEVVRITAAEYLRLAAPSVRLNDQAAAARRSRPGPR
jgi:hypothetical protein